MNYSIIPPRIVCNVCNEQQWADAVNCRQCGVSFRFGVPDIPKTRVYTSNKITGDKK